MLLFINKRNQCYLISTLQAIFAIPQLKNILNIYNTNNDFVNIFNTLINHANDSNRLTVKSDSIMKILFKYDKFFNGKNQEDAHECMIKLLHIISKEYKNKSFYHNFNIIFKSIVTCTKCDYLSETKYSDQFIILTVNGHKNKYSLSELFDYYLQTEKLSAVCMNCNKGNVCKYTKITKLPKILIIVFSKFNQLNTSVDLSKRINIILNDKKYTYNLVSNINHTGNVNSGHYTTDRILSNKWFNFNDEFFYEINHANENNTKCYIAIYTAV